MKYYNECMMCESASFYCLSHNNLEKKHRMSGMFASQNLSVVFCHGVGTDDERIKGRPLDLNTQRCWSIMYGHLDMLQMFVQSGEEIAVFCEDDILIRKDLGKYLSHIVRNFKELKLDVLLLSCLCSNKDFRLYSNFPERPISDYSLHPFTYYAYDSNPESAVWGAQMYMLHRQQAQFLLDTYSNGYADRTIVNNTLIPFSADWTITKQGEKALIYPLVAIEDCQVDYTDMGQDSCRKKCYSIFYNEELFKY